MAFPNSIEIDMPVATLGPVGTDSDFVARSLSNSVQLFGTFREALDAATRADCLALVACGCGSLERDKMDRWVDLHFEYSEHLEMLGTLRRKTKEMCVVLNEKCHGNPTKIGIHPATRHFASKHHPQAHMVYFENKVAAIESCARGEVDACIASTDLATKFSNLVIESRMEPEMIWTLYCRPFVAEKLRGEVDNYGI